MVELVGGPADGEVRTIATDRRELRFYSPLNLSPEFLPEDEMGPPQAMEMIEVVYLRTKKISQAGNRIYQHQK